MSIRRCARVSSDSRVSRATADALAVPEGGSGIVATGLIGDQLAGLLVTCDGVPMYRSGAVAGAEPATVSRPPRG
jgi:hypothetical protein